MEDIHISAEGVTKHFKGLNPSNALRSSGLHPRVLKELASELGPMFAHLFQQSVEILGEISKEWPLANICPLYKIGDISLACNYRPVSLARIPCKLLEHIICSNIMAHLDEHKSLSDRQHAFQKKYSCKTQVITVINDWAKILDKDGQVDTFHLDFEKAFDTFPMNYLNVSYIAIVLVGIVLRGQKQRVVFDYIILFIMQSHILHAHRKEE